MFKSNKCHCFNHVSCIVIVYSIVRNSKPDLTFLMFTASNDNYETLFFFLSCDSRKRRLVIECHHMMSSYLMTKCEPHYCEAQGKGYLLCAVQKCINNFKWLWRRFWFGFQYQILLNICHIRAMQ